MLHLIMQGRINEAILLLFVIVLSLSFHEFGHAWTAKKFGDNTAERQGRLTLNPIVHIDPMGLLMVILVGFGYAKPVPTDPRNFSSPRADLWVSAAGPAMNLVLAFVSINLLAIGISSQSEIFQNAGLIFFLQYMTFINLLLMLFNLLPIGPLDGHYILPHFLSRHLAIKYVRWNAQYGSIALLSLIALSMFGFPIFSFLMNFARTIAGYLIIFD